VKKIWVTVGLLLIRFTPQRKPIHANQSTIAMTKTFKDLQGNVHTLVRCVYLDDNTIMGSYAGKAGTKIFNINLEVR